MLGSETWRHAPEDRLHRRRPARRLLLSLRLRDAELAPLGQTGCKRQSRRPVVMSGRLQLDEPPHIEGSPWKTGVESGHAQCPDTHRKTGMGRPGDDGSKVVPWPAGDVAGCSHATRAGSVVGRLAAPAHLALESADLGIELIEHTTTLLGLQRGSRRRSRRFQGIGTVCSARHSGTRHATLTGRIVGHERHLVRQGGGGAEEGITRAVEDPRGRTAGVGDMDSRFAHEARSSRA